MTNFIKLGLGAFIAVTLTTSAFAGGLGAIGGLGLGGGVSQNRTMDHGGGAGGGGAGNNDRGDDFAAVPQRTIKLACIVGGTPVEFPNDIWVTNTTSATLLKGTALNFTIPSIGVKGSFLLPSNVPSGKQVKIADIFGGAEAGAPCTVKLA
jgi:hypothetical protein